jgi:hypothetical protein
MVLTSDPDGSLQLRSIAAPGLNNPGTAHFIISPAAILPSAGQQALINCIVCEH